MPSGWDDNLAPSQHIYPPQHAFSLYDDISLSLQIMFQMLATPVGHFD